ncbi:MAG TPA: YtxH domain-containing protein [Verrucomicrobiae bacterium]|nr:YtxH domain-containing protein [Verrucomicrobiae bacterium]
MVDTVKARRAGVPAVFFVTGALLGSGIALLTARKTGRESRDYLKGLYGDAGVMAKDYYVKGKDRVNCYYEKGMERVHDLWGKVKDEVKHVAHHEDVVHA